MQWAEKRKFINHPHLENFEESSLNLFERIAIRAAEVESIGFFWEEEILLDMEKAQQLAKDMKKYYALLKTNPDNIDNKTIRETIVFFKNNNIEALIYDPLLEEFDEEINNEDFLLFQAKIDEYLLEFIKKFEKERIAALLHYDVSEQEKKINKILESNGHLSQHLNEIKEETQELLLEIANISIENYIIEHKPYLLDRIQNKIDLPSSTLSQNNNPKHLNNEMLYKQQQLIEDFLFLLQKKEQFSIDLQNNQEILADPSQSIPLKTLKKPKKWATTEEKEEYKQYVLEQINYEQTFFNTTIPTTKNYWIVLSTESRLHYLLNIDKGEFFTLWERLDQHYDLWDFQLYTFFKEIPWTERALLRRLKSFIQDEFIQNQDGIYTIDIPNFLSFIQNDFTQELDTLVPNWENSDYTLEGNLKEIASQLKTYLNNDSIKREKIIWFLQEENTIFEIGEYTDIRDPKKTFYKNKPAIEINALTKDWKKGILVTNGIDSDFFEID